MAGQASVHRLLQQIRQPELGVHSLSAVTQALRDEGLQTEALIQLTDEQ